MDVHDPTKLIGPRSKALSSEQQRKFQELRERRLQLKNTEDVVSLGKKKKKKRGKKGKHPASALEVAGEKEPPPDDRRTIETASFGKEQSHVFAIDAGKGTAALGESIDQLSTAPDSSFYQSSQAGRQSNLEVVASKGPSKIIPAQNPEVPGEEVASSARKKRKKLHWGLEIKERWERKGNM